MGVLRQWDDTLLDQAWCCFNLYIFRALFECILVLTVTVDQFCYDRLRNLVSHSRLDPSNQVALKVSWLWLLSSSDVRILLTKMLINHEPRGCGLEHRLIFFAWCTPCLLHAGQLETTRTTQERVVIGQVKNTLIQLRCRTYSNMLIPKGRLSNVVVLIQRIINEDLCVKKLVELKKMRICYFTVYSKSIIGYVLSLEFGWPGVLHAIANFFTSNSA